MIKKTFAVFFALCVCLCGDEEKPVFAHYMTCFAVTRDSAERQIELAHSYGINGFALNCGEWKRKDKKIGLLRDTYYVKHADLLFDAAKRSGTGFRLFLSPDGGLKEYIERCHEDQAVRYANHPNLFRWKGRPVFSGWGGNEDKYRHAAENLKKKGYDFLIIPSIGMPYHPMMIPSDLIFREVLMKKDCPYDGIFMFSCDGSTRDEMMRNSNLRFAAMQAGKWYMAGVCPSYNSSNLRDFRGAYGYAMQWEALINDNPDMVEIVTWNDYAEDSNLMPNVRRGSGVPREKITFDHDESFLDVTSYYSAFYKTGIRPEITQDKIYICYRSRSRHHSRMFDRATQKWIDLRDRFLQVHDDVEDKIYVTAFLTDDAEISVLQGKDEVHGTMRKGISLFEATMVPGMTPRIRMTRKGKEILNVLGRKKIISAETEANSYIHRSWSPAHRTWISGALSGPPEKILRINEAKTESLTPHNGNAIFRSPNAEAVWKWEKKKSGSHSIRLRYRNPGTEEARLTLHLSVPRFDGDRPFSRIYFPVTFPPTGKQFGSVSFLFTLPAGTDALMLRKDFRPPKKEDTDYSDPGTVEFESLTLIKNRGFRSVKRKENFPEMVLLPGGTFRMGANARTPDERPERRIALSPFALGKYEVTNREFEEFMPEHRSFRCSLSWRDREPVIFVSWIDAAKYCNFLSRKHGLSQYYDEKDWSIIPSADGFRLPTEAQWEYAASGRGENRLYPWGDTLPTEEHGNIARSPLSQSPRFKAQPEGGVTVVGSYPLGASRDGIMDLAGNVAEWCSDRFHPDPPKEMNDPEDLRPAKSGRANYRSIRGGSWGYYNYSQRNCAREFNNPGYSGYIYIGFRLALPEAGMKKLSASVTGKQQAHLIPGD